MHVCSRVKKMFVHMYQQKKNVVVLTHVRGMKNLLVQIQLGIYKNTSTNGYIGTHKFYFLIYVTALSGLPIL